MGTHHIAVINGLWISIKGLLLTKNENEISFIHYRFNWNRSCGQVVFQILRGNFHFYFSNFIHLWEYPSIVHKEGSLFLLIYLENFLSLSVSFDFWLSFNQNRSLLNHVLSDLGFQGHCITSPISKNKRKRMKYLVLKLAPTYRLGRRKKKPLAFSRWPTPCSTGEWRESASSWWLCGSFCRVGRWAGRRSRAEPSGCRPRVSSTAACWPCTKWRPAPVRGANKAQPKKQAQSNRFRDRPTLRGTYIFFEVERLVGK